MPPAVMWTLDAVLTLGMYSYGLNPANSINIWLVGPLVQWPAHHHTAHQSAEYMLAAHRCGLRELLILGMLQKDAEMERPRVPMHRQWHGGMRQWMT